MFIVAKLYTRSHIYASYRLLELISQLTHSQVAFIGLLVQFDEDLQGQLLCVGQLALVNLCKQVEQVVLLVGQGDLRGLVQDDIR